MGDRKTPTLADVQAAADRAAEQVAEWPAWKREVDAPRGRSLHAELLARLRAEREAQSGRPLWPAPSPADDAGVMFPWLCDVVEAQGQAIEELRAEREALAARVESLERACSTLSVP